MPRSDRSLIVAGIFGLGCICFWTGLALGGDWTSQPYEQSEKPYASAQRYRAQPVDAGFAAYPHEESNRCYGAKDHDSADLCAQWRAAIAAEKASDAAIWANRLSIIGAVLTFGGLVFVWLTFRETRRTADAAVEGVRHAARAANATIQSTNLAAAQYRSGYKPWLTVTGQGNYLHDKNPIILTRDYLADNNEWIVPRAHFLIENKGNMPAIIESIVYRIENDPFRYADGPFMIIGKGEFFDIGTANEPGGQFRINPGFPLNLENRDEIRMRPPILQIVIVFTDAINVRRELSFAYAPKTLGDQGIQRAGGRERNYERELTEEA